MTNRIYLTIEDISSWHNDIFDNADYTCRKGKKCIHCSSSRCENHKQEEE
jgi:hypothetical protein